MYGTNRTQKSAIWLDRTQWGQNERTFPYLTLKSTDRNNASFELERSRETFLSKMRKLNELEKTSISTYLHKFVSRNKKECEVRSIRVMPTEHKERLLQYLRQKTPELRKLNLSELSHTSQNLCSDSPIECYTTSTSTKYKLKSLLNKKNMVWNLCKRAKLNYLEKAKISRLAKTPIRITKYELTDKFLEKTDTEAPPKEEYISATEFVKKVPRKLKRIAVSEYHFHAFVTQLLVDNLPITADCHLFAFGYKAIMFPSTGSSFNFIDLCKVIDG